MFSTDANGIIQKAKPNATKHIEADLNLQEEAWLQYVEQFIGEIEALRQILADNTSSLRVMQALRQSLHETESAVSVEQDFVIKLRGLLVMTATLIFSCIVALLMMGLVAAACIHLFLTKRSEYRRLFPKRYRPARGPERHYYWARRKC